VGFFSQRTKPSQAVVERIVVVETALQALTTGDDGVDFQGVEPTATDVGAKADPGVRHQAPHPCRAVQEFPELAHGEGYPTLAASGGAFFQDLGEGQVR
jgi:hypothetical protein